MIDWQVYVKWGLPILLIAIPGILIYKFRKRLSVGEGFQSAPEILVAFLLVAAGLLGVLYELLERVGVDIVHPERFTLGIVGLLALSLGIERFTRFYRIDCRLTSLQEAISNRLPVEVQDGYDNVYDRALGLVKTSVSSSRALVYANNLPLAPERFVVGIVEHLKNNPLTTYHITFVANLSQVPEEFWATVDARAAKMKEAGVKQQFRITFLNAKKLVGFDLIVIDDKHCCVSFSPVSPVEPKTKRQSSIIFENQPAVAKRLRSWLDNLEPLLYEQDYARQIWERAHKARGTPGE